MVTARQTMLMVTEVLYCKYRHACIQASAEPMRLVPPPPRYMSVRFQSGRSPASFSLYNHTTWATQKCFEFHPWKTSKSTPWCFWHYARPFICLRPDTGHRFRTCLYMFPSLFICTFVPLLSSLYLRLPFTHVTIGLCLFVLKLIHVLCHVMAQNTKHETRNTKRETRNRKHTETPVGVSC